MSPRQYPDAMSYQSAQKTLDPQENRTIVVSLSNHNRSSLTNQRFHSVERSLQVRP